MQLQLENLFSRMRLRGCEQKRGFLERLRTRLPAVGKGVEGHLAGNRLERRWGRTARACRVVPARF